MLKYGVKVSNVLKYIFRSILDTCETLGHWPQHLLTILYVSVLDPLYLFWWNNGWWRHCCTCAAFIFLSVVIATCSCSFIFACPKYVLFSLLDNGRYKALLFAAIAKLSQTKQKTGQGKFRQSRPDKLVPKPWKLSADLMVCSWKWQYWAAGMQELKGQLQQWAIEHILHFILI